MNSLKAYWAELQARERIVLGWGSLIVTAILFYALLLQPLYRAIAHMEMALPGLRSNLVWMRQTDRLLETGSGVIVGQEFEGENESLLSVIEATARKANVRNSIKQMVPDQNNKAVRVVLEEADFNKWLLWIDTLYKRYDVDIQQLSAERDDDKPNIAEIRVVFFRGR
jgi:type II secretory pathway component PulM